LQFLDGFGGRRVFVDRDHARSHRMRGSERFPEKAFGLANPLLDRDTSTLP
jgi:hypothetical protein